ncbi:MAG: hypothetical protein M3536_00295, partial [Actinomycetota bacterium]|nr:hypothetical protein [Actinomycetota bacterium]
DRPWRPSKSMRRVLVAAWGSDSNNYIGRRMTLFGDPSVKWGGIAIGGIRLSHVSHITKPLTIALTESKGKRKPFSVDPLQDAPKPPTPTTPTRDWLTEAKAAADTDALRAIWIDAKAGGASDDMLQAIQNAKDS